MPKITLDGGTVTVPDSTEAIADQLLDTNWASNNIKSKDDLVKYLNAGYEQATKMDAGQLAEQVQAQVASQIKELHDMGELGSGPKVDIAAPTGDIILEGVRRATMANGRAAGAELNGHVPSIGALGMVASKRDKTSDIANEVLRVTNAYSGDVSQEGAVLIPEEMRATLLGLNLESGVMSGRATVLPMSTRTLDIPMIDVTSHASTLYGGVQTYWTSEAATMTASSANFGSVRLEVDTHTGFVRVPNELEADTLFLDAYFGQTFPLAMAYGRDEKFIQGNGVGEPLGFLNSSAVVEVAKETGQPAATVVYENIVKMLARLHPQAFAKSIWVINQEVLPELLTMALSVGTGGAPMYVVNAAPGHPMTLFGRPIIVSEKMNALGTAGDIALLDPSFYLIGDRQTATLDTSMHESFTTNQTAYRIVERVAGRPWLDTALTPRRGTATLSPFVTTATRA